MNDVFRRFCMWAADILGASWMFIANVFLILLWLISGPLFGFSDTWQLWVNTITTVVTYLAIFLIQNTQNRDTKAIHLKLDELIRSVEGARNRLVDLENLSDEELRQLQAQFQRLREQACQDGDLPYFTPGLATTRVEKTP
jgi:low affinity Fe/Cu permease